MPFRPPRCLILVLSTLAVIGAAPASRPPELRFASEVFRPLGPRQDPPSWYRTERVAAAPLGRNYRVAITASALTPEQRTRIESAGAELIGYIPAHGYRLRIAEDAESSVRALPFVMWLGEPPAYLKVQPELSALARGPSGPVRLRVLLEAGEPPSRVVQILQGLEAAPAPSGKDGAWRVEVESPADRLSSILSRLADLPEVEAVERARRLVPFNQDAVWVHQSFVGPSPQQTPIFDQGIFGCGQTLALADTGQDHDSCFFRDPVGGAPPFFSCLTAPCPVGSPAPTRRKDIIYYNWSGTSTGDDDTCPATLGSSGHGTHTSGSAAGDQSPFADCAAFTSPGRNGGDGQAPGAKLVIQEMGDGFEYLNNRGGTLWNLADVAYRSGARIHSDSWGAACFDALGVCIPGCTMPYDSFARDADLAMWTYPDLLLVLAAGNAGEFCPPPVSVGTPAVAKSPLVVGSLGHGLDAGTPSSFSSPGPVLDGRLKPAVAAQGELVISAASDANPASNNCATCSLDGTSMSAPTTAGLAALTREYYTAGYYAAGSRAPMMGFVPSGALIKATLIDGAVPLGTAAPGPDFTSGYGRILPGSTLSFTGSPFALRVVDHRAGITTGSVVTRAYDVAGGTPLRATLVWTDYPAALNAAAARVNELKLEVIDPNGAIWFQTLDAGTGAPAQTMNPVDPHDALNVEERLVFDEPAPGRWIVRVRGVDVPWGPQPFALVVRGALSDCPAPAAPGSITLTAPAEHQVMVDWSGVPGAAAYNVYRSFGACPGGPWIPVAAAVPGTSFLDPAVSGGVAYSYYVAAASDAQGACESAPTECASIIPAGDCFLQPEFRGVTSAASAGLSSCTLDLSWEPATPRCGSDVRYNVYRSTSAGFTPSAANRIARCVSGTSYGDAAGLAHTTAYHYIVRAEDAAAGHGGPCRDGNEDGNLVEAAGAPYGPPVLGTFTDDAGDTGSAAFTPVPPWTIASVGGNTGAMVYTAASSDGVCSDLVSPTLTLASPGEGPQLSFVTKHDLDYDPLGFFGAEGSLGQVEIATGPGFSDWTRLPLSPGYPALVEFPLNFCASTANIDTYFSDIDLVYSTYTASLVNWAGGDVRLRFHLSSDLLYPYGNWWIDDIQITKALTPGSCSSLASGPPPIPDGASVAGLPLDVTLSAGDLALTWDAAQCPAAAVNIYWGSLGSYGSFTGGVCSLPASGSATISPPGNVWFVVAATDGASTDGSWSRDDSGGELDYAGATLVCPAITQHVTNNGCP